MAKHDYPILHVDVLLGTLNDKDGKDKTLKLLQYTARLISLTYRDGAEKPKQLTALISQFSQFRKIIRLGNWMTGARRLYKHPQMDLLELVELYTEVFDDIYCLSRMGILSKALGHWSDEHANRGWFISISIKLIQEYEAYQKIGKANKVNIIKLLMDLIFCGIDVFDIQSQHSEKVQTVTGLISGVLSYSKIYKKMYVKEVPAAYTTMTPTRDPISHEPKAE